jgi:CheY-like chemotaxis protein
MRAIGLDPSPQLSSRGTGRTQARASPSTPVTRRGSALPLKSACDAAPDSSSPSASSDSVLRSIAAAESGSKPNKRERARARLNDGGGSGDPEIINPLRIVLVENDAAVAALIAETLESMGHEVCAMTSTETAAVAAAAHYQPDLLIVDVNLDEGSGPAAVERILLTGRVPYIFMSGDPLMVLPLDSPPITLRKPFRDHDLARAIRVAIAVDQTG